MNSVTDEVSNGLEEELDALWRFAWKLTGSEDDAADLVQRTCLRALEQRSSYVAQGKLRSWLFRIEHRIWLNELRSRQIRNHRSFTLVGQDMDGDSFEATLPEDPGTSLSPEGNVLLHQVHQAVESLSESQRIVMLLVCVEGFSYVEAAEILDIPVGTVMSRLARGRIAIGKRMLPQGDKDSTETSSRKTGVKQ